MGVSLECSCGQKLKLKDELAGKRVRCPVCKAVLEVPEPEVPQREIFLIEEMPEGGEDEDSSMFRLQRDPTPPPPPRLPKKKKTSESSERAAEEKRSRRKDDDDSESSSSGQKPLLI